jgi:hypothetical protein
MRARGEAAVMPYAFVQDVSASWDDYRQVTAALLEPTPPGLILHVAGPTDEGFRIIGIWESEQAWRDFQADRIAAAIAALGGPARPEPTFRDLHPVHVVAGARLGGGDDPPGLIAVPVRASSRGSCDRP